MRTLMLLWALACGGCATSVGGRDEAYTLFADIPAVMGTEISERVHIATFDAGHEEAARLGGNLSTPTEYNRHLCEWFAEMSMQQAEPPRRAWCESGRHRRQPSVVDASDLPEIQPASGTAGEHIGGCALTTVRSVGRRAGESGSVIEYENGRWQVDYNTIAGIHNSRIGDQVLLCLIEIPENCPPGDDRGRTYHGVNLRTHESWNAIDSEHSCGGA